MIEQQAEDMNVGSSGATAQGGRMLLNVADYEQAAREILPEQLFHILYGTYGDPAWTASSNNIDAFERIKLRPRVLNDVSNLDLTTTVLGTSISMPVMVAPSGHHQRHHPTGEVGTARGAAAAGTMIALSTASSFSIEEVAEAVPGPRWFQLYLFRDRELTALLVRRAEDAGYRAIAVTVDNPGVRSKERDYRFSYNPYGRPDEQSAPTTLEPERVLRNFRGVDLAGVPAEGTFNDEFDSSFSWSDLAWLRSVTSLPIVIKGIQTGADASLCVEHGIEGLVVSNHGGFGVEGAPGTADILPEIVAAVDGSDCEVYLDGGVRRGTDVLKALAIGARAVFVGRPTIWGLAVNGPDGVRDVLGILRSELEIAMRYCGVADVQSVPRQLAQLP